MRIFVCILLLLSIGSATYAQHLMVRLDHDEDTFVLWATNNFPCSVTLSATAVPYDTTFQTYIPKRQEKLLIRWAAAPDDLFKNPKKMLNYSFFLGHSNVVHDDQYRYNLPYPRGNAYELSQGNNTEHTHNNLTSKYAFDFAMPEGSFIAAARGGVVGYIEDHHKAGAADISLIEKGNRIMICHDDGTVAVYAHLQYNGAIVEIGERVFTGQIIGRSGNTGFSSSPHLHFGVLAGNKSIPIHFRNEYTILYEGLSYGH